MRRERRVRSGEVELHVVEEGTEDGPPVLLLHGFPDEHRVFDRVVEELHDHHVVRFDMRGVGRSTAPGPAGYRIDAVLCDVTAVIDAVFGKTARVHLVGHDWGSVLGFSYVAEHGGAPRVRSFTSVSGPHLGLMWSAGLRRLELGQLLSSWYAFALLLPVLPEVMIRARGVSAYRLGLRRGGVPADDPYLDVTAADVWSRTRHAMELYRQNVLRPPPVPARDSIQTPLLLVIPEDDPFVRPQVFEGLERHVRELEVRRLAASHWVPRSHPRELATWIREHVRRVDRSLSEEASCP